MNSMSWFLYFTDVVRALQVVFGLLTPVFLIIGVICIVTSLTLDEERKFVESDKYGYDKYDTVKIFPFKFLRIWGVLMTIMAFIFCIIAVMIPSKETLYMIAASQVGEQIIQLEEVQSVGGEVGGLAKDTIELLRQSIQEQLIVKPAEGN